MPSKPCKQMSRFHSLMVRSLALVGFLACAAPVHNQIGSPDLDTEVLWQAYWQGDNQKYEEILEGERWESSGSVEAERLWQNFQIKLGRRAELYAEAAQRSAKFPNDPNAQYLFARLQQDPIRLAHQFERLVEKWPIHAWIRLGAAGSQQNLGNFIEAGEHLKQAPSWQDAKEFHHLLSARQAFAQNQTLPWEPIIQDAFEHRNPSALLELQFQARQLDHASMLRLAEAELALRMSTSKDEGARLNVFLERALAEASSEEANDLQVLLSKMDDWATDLELASGWSSASRYHLPFGLGYMLRPEQQPTELSDLLLRNDKALLIGSALFQKPRLLVLSDVRRIEIRWPGSTQPVELLLAQKGQSSDGTFFAGAALFHGFYARRDISDQVARRARPQLERIKPADLRLDQPIQPIEDPGFSPPGRLPEDLDLPLRLRSQTLNGQWDKIEEINWQGLLLHEAGHLPDILPWTEGSGSLWRGLKRGIFSWIQDGMFLGEWEYRAQLRALSSGKGMRWTLADIVETARSPEAPYFKPYRRLLSDLVFLARRQGMPELASWHLIDDESLRALAITLCKQEGIEPMPKEGVQALWQQVDSLQ